MSKLAYRLTLSIYLLILIYGWFLHPSRMQAATGEQRVYLCPLQTTIKMACHAMASKDDRFFYWWIFFFNVAGNILWFIPLGFLLPWKMLWSRKLLNMIGVAVLLSLTAETLQYLLAVGIFDIDDMMFNMLGAILG